MPASTTPSTSGSSIPTPVTPIENMPVDGSAAHFEWTAVQAAEAYRLQIASDAGFEDVLHTVETEPTTLLTLYELLPEDGSRFYWRVQAETRRGWQPWSDGASFRAFTAQHVQAHQAAQQPTATRPETTGAPTSTVQNDVVIEPPYLTGETSGNAVLLFLFMLFGSFTALLLLLLYTNWL